MYSGEFKIKKLLNAHYEEQKPILYKSQILDKLDPKEKKILLSNVGYNFSRFIKIFKKKL